MLSRANLEFGRENTVMRKMHLRYNLKYKNGFESASENTGSGMTAYCCVLFFCFFFPPQVHTAFDVLDRQSSWGKSRAQRRSMIFAETWSHYLPVIIILKLYQQEWKGYQIAVAPVTQILLCLSFWVFDFCRVQKSSFGVFVPLVCY